jgi:catechol 2,3-dioxygenase-like lactoylglutathione lyase family enzyme
MLDHIIVTVSDFARSIAFYKQALMPLGASLVNRLSASASI